MAVALSLVLVGCGGDSGSGSGGGSAGAGGGGAGGGGGDAAKLAGAALTVGSKEFTESVLLGKITAAALENEGAKITDKTGISGSATVRAALQSREIDMYWDYTGTGWVNILGHTPTDLPKDLYKAVSEEDAKKNGIAWLQPAPFENSYAIATTKAFAEQNKLKTMSEAVTYLKGAPDQGVICAASEFLNRDDGLPGLQKAYGFKFTKVNELEFNLIYTQVGKKCPFGEVTTTDGRILANELQVLEDDKNFFLEYRGVLTLRKETLDKHAAIADVMGPISDKLTNEVLTELNSRIDVDAEQPQDVAKDWLESEGLLS